jgi:hypothetical protein
MTAADLDADGDLDLVTANGAPPVFPPQELRDNVSVLVNDGGATFSRVLNFATGTSPVSVAAADIDGDGRLDLCTANSVGEDLAVLFHTGAGNAAFAPPLLRLPIASPVSVTAADLDGDGEMDLAVASGSSAAVSVFWNRGRGAFDVFSDVPVTGGLQLLLLADLDGDGSQDLLASQEYCVLALFGRGDGSFEDGLPLPPERGGRIYGALAEDMDGDGDFDIVVWRDSGVWVLFSDRKRRFRSAARPETTVIAWATALGDVDADGDQDLVVVTEYPEDLLKLYHNDGQGGFVEAQVLPGPSYSGQLHLDDLDADGDLDALATGSGGSVVLLFRNGGAGSFDSVVELSLDMAEGLVEPGDFDGDGDTDLAVGPNCYNRWPCSSRLALFLNRGDGEFVAAADLPFPGRSASTVKSADLDGDLDLDLIAVSGGVIAAYPNRGDGSFSGPSLYHGDATALAIADLDGDRDVDFAVGTSRGYAVILNATEGPTSRDANRNGVPDECEGPLFHRGDPSGDGRIDLTDAVRVFRYLFQGGEVPDCLDAADADDDGTLTLSDGVFLLRFLFRGGFPPRPPGPPGAPCGLDREAGSAGDLGCEGYTAC